jgi:hypothetical protein
MVILHSNGLVPTGCSPRADLNRNPAAIANPKQSTAQEFKMPADLEKPQLDVVSRLWLGIGPKRRRYNN